MITESITDAIACPEFSSISSETDERFLKIKEWYEFINDQQLQFGRYLAQVKEETKRQFGKGLEAVGLVKAEMNKLVKAVHIADNLPAKLAPKLNMHILLRLGQKRNEDAVARLTEDDTPLSVTEKIKQYQKPPRPLTPKPAMSWEKNKFGSRTLTLRLPDGDTALAIETGYKKSGLPLPLYISSLVNQESEDSSQCWHQAQEELAQYMDAQSAEIESLLNKIQRSSEMIARLTAPKDATEWMILRTAKEDKQKAEIRLKMLFSA